MNFTPVKVVILTGTELRHEFFAYSLALHPALHVLATICEKSLTLASSVAELEDGDEVALRHVQLREWSEQDFFSAFTQLAPDHRNAMIVAKGAINDDLHLQSYIRTLDPDVLICYGTSIIREPLLGEFSGRFLNIHLGLSPYYRGGGTNFWPLVNGEPEFVGVTFMHIDAGVDTGRVVHQMRPIVRSEDTIHSLGNRLIRDMTLSTPLVVRNLRVLPPIDQAEMNPALLPERVYRRRDFNGRAVLQAQQNLADGMLNEYLLHKEDRDRKAPILERWDLLE